MLIFISFYESCIRLCIIFTSTMHYGIALNFLSSQTFKDTNLSMKKNLLFVLLCAYSLLAVGQDTFRGSMSCKEENLHLTIDLYKESINVPGMEMFGPMHGFLNGNVYGIWSITSSKIIDENNAVIRLSNDQGSETQEVKLTKNNEGYTFEQVNGACIKKVVGKKLVKIPKKLIFKIGK